MEDTPHTAVIHHGDAKAHLWLIVRGPRHLRRRKAALLGPGDDRTVAKLSVLLVALQVVVKPVEWALLGQADGEDSLLFAILHLLGCRLDRRVLRQRIFQHVAGEGQGHQRLGAKVVVDAKIPEGERRKELLALEALGQRLGLAGTDAVLEKADGVCIGAATVKVQQEADDVALAKLLRARLLLFVMVEGTFHVEADAILAVTKEERCSSG
mmetsp:Transcript_95968/g.254929  ORF Transcript_95968/g.254929 Transcript_95968/m.254929 type:complete len:211 (+) Transcript_95968:1047-1679(+)